MAAYRRVDGFKSPVTCLRQYAVELS